MQLRLLNKKENYYPMSRPCSLSKDFHLDRKSVVTALVACVYETDIEGVDKEIVLKMKEQLHQPVLELEKRVFDIKKVTKQNLLDANFCAINRKHIKNIHLLYGFIKLLI